MSSLYRASVDRFTPVRSFCFSTYSAYAANVWWLSRESNYSKTRNIYTAYHNAKDKKAYLATHKDEIALHESAKKAFDKLGGKKIPKVAEIQAEFSSLLVEKKELYQEYRKARKDMTDLGTARQNIERILNIRQPNEKSQDTQR